MILKNHSQPDDEFHPLENFFGNKKRFYYFLISLGIPILGIYAAFGLSEFSVPILLKQRNISNLFNSVSYSAYLFSFITGALLVVPLLKKYSSRYIFSSATIALLLSLLILAFFPTTWLIVSFHSLQGICCGIIIVFFYKIIATVSNYQKNSGLVSGSLIALTSAGYLLGIILGMSKIKILDHGFFMMFLFTAGCSVSIFFSKNIYTILDLQTQEMTNHAYNLIKSIKDIFRNPVCFFFVMMFGINDNIIIGLSPILVLDKGDTVIDSGKILCIYILGGALCCSFFSSLLKYLGFIKIAVVYFLLASCCGIFMLTILNEITKGSISLKYIYLSSFLLFIIGGTINSFRALYVCLLGNEFQGTSLTEAFVAILILSHLISAVVSPICGCAINWNGCHKLGIALITMNTFLFFIFLCQIFTKSFFLKSRL
jgi:MFS family permease